MSRPSALSRSASVTGLLLLGAAWWLAPSAARAQVASVSGMVKERSGSAMVGGATVRLSESGVYITDLDGWFRFDRVAAGRHILTVEAFGYQPRSLDVVIRGDTLLEVELEPDPIALDSLVVEAGEVSVRGTIRDASTGQDVLYAQVYVEPNARTVGAVSGTFVVRGVAVGEPTTLSVEAIEYLPARIALIPGRDTTLAVELQPDSVGIRMVAQQVQRLERRSHSVPLAMTTYGREDMLRLGAWSAEDLIRRRMDVLASRRAGEGLPIPCLLIDDLPAEPDLLPGLYAGQVERIEIFARGRMVRVYTKRYVASLMGRRMLPPIIYSAIGLGRVCR